MFWRFGFHNASAIDSLLDKEDVSVEAILDEDDLLQECKAQNTRLIDYFQRVDVLQRLLKHVSGQIENEEHGQFKYPYVSTEVLCSEIWSIVETCVNSQTELLVPFWDAILDRSPEDMKTQMVMASHFAKINAVFLGKRPAEMLAFIRAQPDIVERILRHIETPSFIDLLVRIIQLDEQPGGAGVLEWLSSENLMARLLVFLAPTYSPDVHNVVAELIKGIISMATPTPGAGLGEMTAGPASNIFARQLASMESVKTLSGYILLDYKTPPPDQAETETLPNAESCTSSVVHSIAIVIELIRKNNSNYFEPYLFHTLRNRLIQVQQHLGPAALEEDGDGGREQLESALGEMVDRIGVVHLGPLLELITEKLDGLQGYLRSPRSVNGTIKTTVGDIAPLTFERYRICELLAEMLHCSNMALLNRGIEHSRLYDSEGRLQGGLAALEELAQVIALNPGSEDRDTPMRSRDDIAPAHELPVSGGLSSLSDSDEDMSDDEPGSSDEDLMEDDTPFPISKPHAPLPPSGSPPLQQESAPSASPVLPTPSSSPSIRSQRARQSVVLELPPGELFKRRFVELNILSTLLDLFFEFPWNNFLHSAVYDLTHQILTGTVDNGGQSRELAISLFRDAKLMQRIIEGQKMNDAAQDKPKAVRLGYMGHLTLISEDVLTAMERFPTDVREAIEPFVPQPDWDEYVKGRYKETKQRDAEPLGGGKPVIRSTMAGSSRWKVDEEDTTGTAVTGTTTAATTSDSDANVKGEFKRASSSRPRREGSADFGPADANENDGFEVRSAAFYESSDSFDSDDEDDSNGGWLSQSKFSLGQPPATGRPERRPLSASGFDDAFEPGASDPFADDDGFGPFSDSGSDAFSFADEMDDTAFDSFGDFGEFHGSSSIQDGELTPTGSWTFASGSGSDDAGSEPFDPHSPQGDKRMS
ncbi:unnamed protein product [Mycena citricolor]|uniref:SAPS-domain-containing protein n=1 Tax=Mycena citricolor TaxID=2018698 RepID=A0AAD2HLC8_9AGAR|nr:unnamed protein product [Mycena citricolor]